MRNPGFIVFALVLAACGSGAPDSESPAALVDPARLDATLAGFVDRGELVGVSALVYENGEEAWFGAFGMADREADRPMQRDSLVQIFSMTKPFTGVALMTLYEEGLFELNDPIAKYLPEYANLVVLDDDGNERPPARPPTIRDLMRHTAGFAGDELEGPVGDRYRAANPDNWQNTLAELSQKLATVPLFYDPGTRWYYGPSVDVQAHLVEVLSGQSFKDVLQERIFDPLGLSETQYTLRPDQRGRFTALYERHPDGSYTRFSDDALAFNLNEWPMTPGGWGLTSTLDDYMRLARMLQNGGELDGVRILQAKTIELMATDALPSDVTDKSWLPNKGQVGFGIEFAVRTAPPASNAEASGAVGEFFWDGAANTLFWVDPVNDITAVLFNIYRPWGKVEIQKDFRDAIYYRDETASALNKPDAPPGTPTLSD